MASLDYYIPPSTSSGDQHWRLPQFATQRLLDSYKSCATQSRFPLQQSNSWLAIHPSPPLSFVGMSRSGSSRPRLQVSPVRGAAWARLDTRPALQRSHSTPLVPTMSGSSEAGASGSQADKKRNKLGYHRTSIACSMVRSTRIQKQRNANHSQLGHCRRRKIRCMVPTDAPNRCSNCIRLKKECSFHPVDQPHEPHTKSITHIPVGAVLASQSLSSIHSATTPDSSVESTYGGLSTPNSLGGPVALPSSGSMFSSSMLTDCNITLFA